MSLLSRIQARRNDIYSKKQKELPLEITKKTVSTLKWREIERLLASGQLSKTVTVRFANERGTKRLRRDLDAVRDDVLLAWPESQEVVRIGAEPEPDDLAPGSKFTLRVKHECYVFS